METTPPTAQKCVYTIVLDNWFPELCAVWSVLRHWQPRYELGANNDWNILIDADIAIGPHMYDVTRMLAPNQIGAWMSYEPWITIKEGDEHIRPGNQAIATCFVAVPHACHEAWKPLPFTSKEALERMKRQFVVDEYCMSRNIVEHQFQLSGISLPGVEQHLLHCNVTTENMSREKAVDRLKYFLNMQDINAQHIGA